MKFDFIEIEKVEKLSKKEFIENYYNKQKPVVITNQIEDWPAFTKWRFPYLRQVAGDRIVPLYDNRKTDHTKKVNEPDFRMSMSNYIDELEKGPTHLRIFLYNLLKDVPLLKKDVRWPKLGLRLVKSLPYVFFGGQNARVFMHFDIDYSNIFHIHFEGIKQCILVSPDETKYMYRLPYSWICHEDIDFENVDFEKFPALRKVKPYITELKHGEMLYMPEGWWHYMKYKTPGFSLSLRALPRNPKHILKAMRNILLFRFYDNLMRKRKGQKWLDYKDEKAISKTNSELKNA